MVHVGLEQTVIEITDCFTDFILLRAITSASKCLTHVGSPQHRASQFEMMRSLYVARFTYRVRQQSVDDCSTPRRKIKRLTTIVCANDP